jgi:hypothetical protein
MSQLDLKAIRARNEKRKRNYGESEQKAPGELYTTGADEDIDALIAEVERHSCKCGHMMREHFPEHEWGGLPCGAEDFHCRCESFRTRLDSE